MEKVVGMERLQLCWHRGLAEEKRQFLDDQRQRNAVEGKRLNHCTECSGDEPREAAGASFCLFYGPAMPSPGQGRRSEYSHCASEASDSCSMMIGLRAQAGLPFVEADSEFTFSGDPR